MTFHKIYYRSNLRLVVDAFYPEIRQSHLFSMLARGTAMAASAFQHLTPDARPFLFRIHEARLGVAKMAARLGRDHSIIFRELGQNRSRDPDASRDRRRAMSGYYPVAAKAWAVPGTSTCPPRHSVDLSLRLRGAAAASPLVAGRCSGVARSASPVCREAVDQPLRCCSG